MRFIACAIVVSTGVVGMIGSALAVDLTGAEIKAFLTGKTIYLETTAASARLLEQLVSSAPAKDREVEAAKRRARSAERFAA